MNLKLLVLLGMRLKLIWYLTFLLVACAPVQNNWDIIRTQDKATVAQGWSVPERLAVNSDGWEDSSFITADGNKLYFSFYPGDLLTDAKKGKFTDDIDIYVSLKPFTQKSKASEFYLSEDIWSEAGLMISGQDYFYNTNRDYLNDQKSDTDIYQNLDRLSFNDDTNQNNPHYCRAKDELWFDEDDKKIFVMEHAARDGFTGELRLVGEPINKGGSNFQPWLSEDCNTLYFTSGRDSTITVPKTKIFMSQKVNSIWSEPIVIVESNFLIGEPSLTVNQKELYFVQIFKGKGAFQADIYRTRRVT